jgi:hypothetical protein
MANLTTADGEARVLGWLPSYLRKVQLCYGCAAQSPGPGVVNCLTGLCSLSLVPSLPIDVTL